MADNLVTTATVSTVPIGTRIATHKILSWSGEEADIAPVGLVLVAGAEGAKTATDISAGNPLPVTGAVTISGVSTAANQTTIIGHLDGVEGLLTTLDGRVDGLETLIGTSNTALSAIQTAVQILDNAIAGSEMQVDIVSGGLSITRPATATLANVSTSTASATLQASNANRLGWTCFNDSDNFLYIKFGTTASATSFTVRVDPGANFKEDTGYTGRIDGILAASTGTARVTELTA